MTLKGKTIEFETEKLVFGGTALGRYQNKVVFVYNALPGERVKAWVSQDKRDYAHAIVTDVLEASPFRQNPPEAHFLSCSPWQIMDFARENFWKQEIILEVFRSIAGLEWEDIKLNAEEQRFHYRNKMEFSFQEVSGEVSLAFFKRGQKRKEAIPQCILAHSAINEVALEVVETSNRYRVPASSLKTMILRGNQAGEIIAALFCKDPQISLMPEISADSALKGFSLHYSDPRSPASVSTELLSGQGATCLTERVLGKPMRFGVMSFFQVNVTLFEKVLESIKTFVSGEDVLDYYCGVGAIGIALCDLLKSCVMVDSSEDSILNAQENIQLNELAHFSAYCGKAEKLLEHIVPQKVIIIDPPRSGMHPKVLRVLRENPPKRIVYLSCNISTCARDLKQLDREYHLVHKEAYNFFPATPHIEFLAVLDRKKPA